MRKLYRVRDGKKIAGVCGGLAKYVNVSSMKKIKLKEWKIPIKTVIMVITTKPKTESKGIFHGRAINTDIL